MARLMHPSGASSLDLTNAGVKPRRPVMCKSCNVQITDMGFLLSLAFNGFAGKAGLFTKISNVVLSDPSVRLMYTGAHTIQEMGCARCKAYLGWRIVHAHEWSETWKDGKSLLELECLSGHEKWGDTEMPQRRHTRRATANPASIANPERRYMQRVTKKAAQFVSTDD